MVPAGGGPAPAGAARPGGTSTAFFRLASASFSSWAFINPPLSMKDITYRIPRPMPPKNRSQEKNATITNRLINSHSLRRKNHQAKASRPIRSHSILGRPAEAWPPDFGRSKLS